jgi:hypothetical protein
MALLSDQWNKATQPGGGVIRVAGAAAVSPAVNVAQ